MLYYFRLVLLNLCNKLGDGNAVSLQLIGVGTRRNKLGDGSAVSLQLIGVGHGAIN